MLWIGIALLLATGIIIYLLFKVYIQMNNQLNITTKQVSDRLQEMTGSLQETHKTIGDRLKVFGEVQLSLGQLKGATQNMLEIGRNISSLQELLRPPQLRGEVGETLLGNILMQVFGEHKEFYQLQYQFKSGERVDAIIHIGKNFVPIDAKFPFEIYKRMINGKTEEERRLCRRDFIINIKKKVDDIASKYILPDEGTTDFAFMYVPAESIYYEIVNDGQILSYAHQKKVIPVSPNSFYPYLKLIWKGLQGLMVERDAQKILANLGRLQGDLDRFREDFEVLGKHILNAGQKYDEAERKLDRIEDKLLGTQDIKPIESKKEDRDDR